jgi:uncharacterized protein YndB with AHSA1/START domain
MMNGHTGELVLKLTCALDASPERVFRTRTEPAELATCVVAIWVHLREAALDLRVDGCYRFAMQPPMPTSFISVANSRN